MRSRDIGPSRFDSLAGLIGTGFSSDLLGAPGLFVSAYVALWWDDLIELPDYQAQVCL